MNDKTNKRGETTMSDERKEVSEEQPRTPQTLPGALPGPGERRVNKGYEGRPPNNEQPDPPSEYLNPPERADQTENQRD